MQRDLNLVREILLAVEDSKGPIRGVPKIEGYPESQIGYHVIILNEAGLLTAVTERIGKQILVVSVERLTWKGHEYLDGLRNESA